LLLHVVDASHPQVEEQIQAVLAVLDEIGAGGKPTMMVFNKVDRLTGGQNAAENGEARPGASLRTLMERHPGAVAVSALTGEGLPGLLAELGSQIRPERELLDLSVPHEAAEVIARLHAVGQVLERDYEGPLARFKVRIPPHLHAEFAGFKVRE
jgi:GTP-binding protein HflX